jgi:hypothetical protein
MVFVFVWLLCAITAPSAFAADAPDDLPDLKDKYVLYAGGFEEMPCPPLGKFDCRSWPAGLLKTNQGDAICFAPQRATCSTSCRGIIAAGRDNAPHLYVIGGATIAEVKESPVTIYKCPTAPK